MERIGLFSGVLLFSVLCLLPQVKAQYLKLFGKNFNLTFKSPDRYKSMTCPTSKDRDLIRIPRSVALPFMCQFHCFSRIVVEHSPYEQLEHMSFSRKAYKMGALFLHSRHNFSKSKFTISSLNLCLQLLTWKVVYFYKCHFATQLAGELS